jgi:para-aminobenzoate synthetase component 1
MTPLVEELVPCPDPWAVARKLAHLPHLLFLDSADRHPERGRYSYVTADPVEAYIWNRGYSGDPFPGDISTEDWTRFRTVDGIPPFQGGVGALLGYELGGAFESLPWGGLSEIPTVDYWNGIYDFVVSFDHTTGRGWIVSTGYDPAHSKDDSFSRTRAADRIVQVRRLLAESAIDNGTEHPRTVQGTSQTPQHPLPNHPGVFSNFSPDGYRDAVRRAVEYVHAGDVFQVNLSQRLLAPLTEHPLDLYGRLRTINPAPFACYFDAGDFQIVSASPERFLQVSPTGDVVTKPIKGTRRRGSTPEEDAALVRDLLGSEKDRAENVMIVDLLRNDLGRVCEYGSVTVPKVCELETYRYVHHLVSEVRGKLRPGMSPFDLLRAAFPGGSVTGAPKVRAMEIIDGATDTNILIRTFTAGRGWVQFPVGGGIVADSDPDREYEETLHKAAGLLRALR